MVLSAPLCEICVTALGKTLLDPLLPDKRPQFLPHF